LPKVKPAGSGWKTRTTPRSTPRRQASKQKPAVKVVGASFGKSPASKKRPKQVPLQKEWSVEKAVGPHFQEKLKDLIDHCKLNDTLHKQLKIAVETDDHNWLGSIASFQRCATEIFGNFKHYVALAEKVIAAERKRLIDVDKELIALGRPPKHPELVEETEVVESVPAPVVKLAERKKPPTIRRYSGRQGRRAA